MAVAVTTGVLASSVAGSPAGAQEPQETRKETTAKSTHIDRVMKDERIRESSGLARSSYDRPVLFTHNDSGDGPRIFAVGNTGETLGVLTFQGAKARDWEDIAAGPDHSLWVGDIGDNRQKRPDVTVYRIDEPEDLSDKTVDSTAYEFKYPDGANNAEALLVNPVTGRLVIATKSRNGAGIYEAPETLSTGAPNKLTRVGSAPVLITGGAFFPDGKQFVLRNHNWAYLYDGLGSEPTQLRLPKQRQGESIDVSRDGDSLFAGTEGKKSPVDQVVLNGASEPPEEPPTDPNDDPPTDPNDDEGTPDGPGDTGGDDGDPMSWQPDSPAVPANGSVEPESFGAVGDGVHDDAKALQSALDRAAKTGAKVKLAEGSTYLSRSRLQLPSGTYLYGAGAESVLKFTWTDNDKSNDGYYLGNKEQVDGGDTDITLTNFKVMGAGAGVPAGLKKTQKHPQVPAIRLRLVDRFELSNLEVSHAPGISVIYQGVSNGLVRENYIHNSGRDGINSTWHIENLHDIIVEKNRIEKIGDDGIAVIGAPGRTANKKALPYNVMIRDNEILGWEKDPNGQQLGRGIALLAVTHVSLVDNLIDGTDSHGIMVAPSTRSFSTDPKTGERWRSSYVDIIGNHVIDAGQAKADRKDNRSRNGIVVKPADHVTLKENVVENSSGKAVAMHGCKNCTSDE